MIGLCSFRASGLLLLAVTAWGSPMIHLVGDSTMSDKRDLSHPERGWGQLLPERVVPPAVVRNHAVNGRSSRSFREEGRWQVLLDELQPGDWVIIQFGHNDQKSEDPTRYAAPEGDYQENLRRFVQEVRAAGGHAVLATSIARRRWNERGDLVDTHGAYPAAMRAAARAEGVPLLELTERTGALLRSLGPEPSKELFLWVAERNLQDDTHLSATGARAVADLAVAEIQRLGLPLADHLTPQRESAP